VRPIPVTVGGKLFASIKDAALQYRQHPSRVHSRVREGWTIEQALLIERRAGKSPPGRAVTHKGVRYRSLVDLANVTGVRHHNLVSRLGRGYSVEDAVTGKARESRGNSRPIAFGGKRYPSREALCQQYGTRWGVFHAVWAVAGRWSRHSESSRPHRVSRRPHPKSAAVQTPPLAASISYSRRSMSREYANCECCCCSAWWVHHPPKLRSSVFAAAAAGACRLQ
jgi:hypothetical protein